jgi:hypothetical protein
MRSCNGASSQSWRVATRVLAAGELRVLNVGGRNNFARVIEVPAHRVVGHLRFAVALQSQRDQGAK